MKYWEAIKCLEEGKKVRHMSWHDDNYLYTDSRGVVRKNIGGVSCIYKEVIDVDSKWELYDDRKEVPQIVKDLYKSLEMYSDENICDKYETCGSCPFWGYDFCGDITKLWEELQKMNKEYKLDK